MFVWLTGSEKLGQTLKVTSDEAKGFMDSFLGMSTIEINEWQSCRVR